MKINTPKIILTTPRLILRIWEVSDIPLMALIHYLFKKLSSFIYLLGIVLTTMTYSVSHAEKKNMNHMPINSIIPLEQLPTVYKKMNPSGWPKDCPISIDELVYVTVRYLGFDNKPHVGALIVNKALAQEVLAIFQKLYEYQFPIESIRPIHELNNNDEISMKMNNTSAFNCREITGQPGIFSQHAYGRAIDINPRINPYVKNNLAFPEGSEPFVDRSKSTPGKITLHSLPYALFKEQGWDWGGEWHDLQDYQHFEKREHGKKRNPSGYVDVS